MLTSSSRAAVSVDLHSRHDGRVRFVAVSPVQR